jgi:hypothetical protein
MARRYPKSPGQCSWGDCQRTALRRVSYTMPGWGWPHEILDLCDHHAQFDAILLRLSELNGGGRIYGVRSEVAL